MKNKLYNLGFKRGQEYAKKCKVAKIDSDATINYNGKRVIAPDKETAKSFFYLDASILEEENRPEEVEIEIEKHEAVFYGARTIFNEGIVDGIHKIWSEKCN